MCHEALCGGLTSSESATRAWYATKLGRATTTSRVIIHDMRKRTTSKPKSDRTERKSVNKPEMTASTAMMS
eukprot:4647528-Pleurochrysis_carterae.AAC.4